MASLDISKFVDGSGNEFNFRDPTKQPVADRVTSIRAASSATDAKYPTEKAVAKAVESASVADKLYANQLWGGAFRRSLSPGDVYFMGQRNSFFGPVASAITVEYSTDGGQTWIDYGLTDSQKVSLFSQYGTQMIYCGKNTHIHPGYTGSTVGTKDLTNDMVPDQRVRVTISCMKTATQKWLYARIRRFGLYIATNSANVPDSVGSKHCVILLRTSNNVSAGVDSWVELGDYNVAGDGGWNSVPCGNDTADGGKIFGNASGYFQEIRMVFWSEGLSTNPSASQTGNLAVRNILAFSELIWECNGINPNMTKYGIPCTVSSDGVANFNYGIKFTARKLKANLARTSDSTFDGSVDQLNIPVTGTLPVGNGGTGKSSVTSGNYLVGNGTSALTEKTPKDAGSDVLKSLDTDNGDVVDGDYIVTSYHVNASTISSTTFVRRTAVKLWNYIKSKLSGSDVNIGGNAATATTAQNYDTSTGTIKSALAEKSDTGHVHNTDANEVTSNSTNLAVITDDTEIVTTHTSGYNAEDKRLFRRPAGSKIWPWIQSKIEADSGYINYTYNVTGDTNINSHVLAGIILPGSSLGSCRLMFAMVVNFNIGEGTGCGGLVKVHIEISGGGIYYVKRISLSNVTGDLSISDLKIVEGTSANKKVVGLVWNGVLLANRPMQATVLSRHVVGGDFVYNGDVASGTNIAWETGGARVWAEDGNVVHTTGDETIKGTKTFSNTTTGNDLDVNLQSVTNNGTFKMGVEIAASGRRGLWDYGGTGIAGEGKWIIFKDTDNVVHVGDASAEPNTIRLGKLTIDTSGTIGNASNTLYIG